MRRDDGFTLLEILISAVIVAVIVGGAYSVLFTGVDTYGTGTTLVDLQEHGNRVVDQVARHLAVSGKATLSPLPVLPASTSVVTFQESLGYTAGAIQWGPPTRIALQGDAVVRIDEVGLPGERTTVLTRWVPRLLEGEVANGADDNGNGLVDEPGFCLSRDGDVWTIRLTLEKPDAKGRLHVRTVETAVIPRN